MNVTLSHSFMLASLRTVCHVPFPIPMDNMSSVIVFCLSVSLFKGVAKVL